MHLPVNRGLYRYETRNQETRNQVINVGATYATSVLKSPLINIGATLDRRLRRRPKGAPTLKRVSCLVGSSTLIATCGNDGMVSWTGPRPAQGRPQCAHTSHLNVTVTCCIVCPFLRLRSLSSHHDVSFDRFSVKTS